ncbi:hypothetical protein [Psychroflexus halocasei]|uniref:Uncharacterized protein n=1 Tax=Psychroflexus halocasei TaxID=908615 RepID=A0A1H4A0N6_9FLAO|nr:hypothetical protein [Psychroflexus halocasei]SEA29388.1 hypothetical protein SAMN05421540_104271 [Psychroflexus halocasei]
MLNKRPYLEQAIKMLDQILRKTERIHDTKKAYYLNLNLMMIFKSIKNQILIKTKNPELIKSGLFK